MTDFKTINNLTIDEVSAAAEKNSGEYVDRFQKVAKAAFIEGVLWAQKVHKERRLC